MTISLNIEIPETLYDSLQVHLNRHSDWDQDRAMTTALSLFLLQNAKDANAEKNLSEHLFAEESTGIPSQNID
jgi:endonuclease III-like uncharacterized protein